MIRQEDWGEARRSGVTIPYVWYKLGLGVGAHKGPASECPYKVGFPAYRMWMRGWSCGLRMHARSNILHSVL